MTQSANREQQEFRELLRSLESLLEGPTGISAVDAGADPRPTKTASAENSADPAGAADLSEIVRLLRDMDAQLRTASQNVLTFA